MRSKKVFTYTVPARFVSLICMHLCAGSSPAWFIVCVLTVSFFALSFFALSHQCLKMHVIDGDVET